MADEDAVQAPAPGERVCTCAHDGWYDYRCACCNRRPGRVSVDWQGRAERAEAHLAEVRQAIAAFFTHHGNSTVFALRSARDLAEGIRQVLDRAALEPPEAAREPRP